MLLVEDRFMIKELHRKGISISEIAHLTGCDRKTVRNAISRPLVREHQPRQGKRRKIDPYVDFLNRRIGEGVLNGNKLYDEIKAQGYPGGRSQVRAYVHPLRPPRQGVATLRFETEPGEQAQVDWGHFGLINHHGRQRRLYAFVMTLGWSRAMYLEFTISADTGWFLRCHLHAFHYFGGVPRMVLHDNLKTAVLGREADGGIHWNPRYLDFANYYGFTPKACQPYRAQTKGKVESGIRYVRSYFWVGLTFVDLADLNRQALEWLDTIANRRIHGTTRVVPFERLGQEGLQSMLGKADYDTSVISHRRSSNDCLIAYEGNHYSIPSLYHRQQLLVKETEEGILLIFDSLGVEIARHRLARGHHQQIVESAHYRSLWAPAGKKPKRSSARQVGGESEHAKLTAAPVVETRPLEWYEQMLEEAA
jgi:transposase